MRKKRQARLETLILEDRVVPALAAVEGFDSTGFTPAMLRHAYGMDAVSFGRQVGDGSGQTIAIVAAYDEPNLVSDVAAFDAYYGLPDPTSLRRINQVGGESLPRPDVRGGWGAEIALDVEWAHVAAPRAGLIVVEANSASEADLFTAVDTARNLPGVSVVSMSWGRRESATDAANDFLFTTPAGHIGVTFLAAVGDSGATVQYPAASPNVVSVGGTTLTHVADQWVEGGWGAGTNSDRLGGSGGGLSQYSAQPNYQRGVVKQSRIARAVPDVAIDAAPDGTVSIYDSYDNGSDSPWQHIGGTSLTTPLWAGIIALADQGRAADGFESLDGRDGTLPRLYSLSSTDFEDVTSGDNGFAAEPGFDLVTGRGSPIVNVLVIDLAADPKLSTADDVGRSGASASLQGFQISSSEVFEPFTFSNWNAIGPAIGAVPNSAGPISNVSVVNFGTTVYTGPLDVTNTLNRIRANGTPFDAHDGSVYSNNNGLLPNGSWYEFVVSPSTGTDHNFSSQFSSPGPMRILLDTLSDVYFTGDHYSSFKLVYQHGQATPTIGSFSLSPSSVAAGTSTTLTASNVTETGGTIASVKFYRESNGSSGLQIGSDTLLGTGTQSGTTWTFATSTTGLTAGNYAYYAVATDSASTSSPASSANLTVTSGTPTPAIGSFTLNPVSVTIGNSTTLTAANVTETGGTISSVKFYRESNGTSGLQTATDTLLGTGSQAGTTWTLATSTTGLTAGNYTYYALASDTVGTTNSATTTLAVTNPAASGVALAWDVNGQTNYGSQGLGASQVANGLTNSTGLTRGSGVTTINTAAGNAWGGNGWATTSALGVSGSAIATFGMTVDPGHTLSLSSIDLYYRRSSSGPPDGLWQYQLAGGSWVTIADVTSEFSSTSTTGAAMAQLNLAGTVALQNIAAGTAVNFRIVPYGSTNTGGAWYVYDTAGNDLVVSGVVATVPSAISHDSPSVTVNEGSTANNTGTFSDSLGNNAVTLTASVGTVTQNNSLGTWSWTYSTQDGPSNSQTVTVTATNSQGGIATTTFPLNVTNVAPTGTASYPSVALPNSQVTASITGVTDPSPVDAAAGYAYSFDWTNDGNFDIVQSSNNSANHAYATPGNYTVRMRVEDKDAGYTDYLKTIVVAAPPTVTGVVFGDGTNQRSLVKQIVVTFSEAVNFTPDVASAMTVNRTGTGGTQGEVVLAANPASGPASSVTITFSGALTESAGSLVDGIYNFIMGAAQVTGAAGALDGNNDGIPGGDYAVTGSTANKFFRFYGDQNGDAAVDQNDYLVFRNALSGGPSTVFDFDNSGDVDQNDYLRFRQNISGSP
ncbi:MAG: ribonuclease domain-containing protein [Gemmataceae bacterium]